MKFTLVSSSMAAYSTVLKNLSYNTSRFCLATLGKRTQSLSQLSMESGHAAAPWSGRELAGNSSSSSRSQPTLFYSTSSSHTGLDASSKQPLNYSNESSSQGKSVAAKRDPNLKPTNEQLIAIKEKLTAHLPRFLLETHPYVLYTPDVIFENFYKEPGKVTVGALQYAMQLTALRWKIHWKFSAAQIQILKITHHDTDGTIKIRWRVAGIRGAKTFTQPWKIKFWKVKESVATEAEWHDGFSILYVRGDGLIYKHRLDRIMPQQDQEAGEKKKKLVPNLNISSPMFSGLRTSCL